MVNKIRLIGKKCLIACLVSTVVVIGGGLDCGRVEAGEPVEIETEGSILKYNLDDNKGTATVVGYESIAENTLIIPDTVTYEENDRTYKVTEIGDYAFADCGYQGSLILGDNVKRIGNNAFGWIFNKDSNIEANFTGTLTIPNSVEVIGDKAFYCCGFNGDLTIPGTVHSIGNAAFCGCFSFTGNLNIQDGVTLIGKSAFEVCGFNGDLTLPNTLTSIESYTFQSTYFTGDLIIPEGVTTIERYAFFINFFDGSITIPDSITSIGQYAFCSSQGFALLEYDLIKFIDGTTMQVGTCEIENGGSLSLADLNNKATSAYVYPVSDKVSILDNAISGDAEGEAIVFCKNDNNEMVKYKVTVVPEGTTPKDPKILFTESTPSNSNTSANTNTSSTPYIAPQWVPTTPEDIFRFSLRGQEDVFYNVLETEDTIQMVKEIQGPLFFDAVALVQGDYKLARTYTILVNNSLVYKTEKNTKITLQIPQEIQKEGRTFRMFGVTENGKNFVLEDSDKDPATITFATNQFYAFALGYLD